MRYEKGMPRLRVAAVFLAEMAAVSMSSASGNYVLNGLLAKAASIGRATELSFLILTTKKIAS
jgi:hypothetical protein